MLGKSVGACLVVAVAFGLTGCPHNVKQDKATGEDGFSKGAVEMVLDQGEATTTGIVTYPGGDRVDWKIIELPEKQRGTLDVKLTWTPPRPGLQLNFDVFNEWYEPIINGEKQSKTSKKKKKRKTGKIRTASVDNAKGKYYIRVYADGRGDAGKYRLTVSFTEQVAGPIFNPLEVELADPPRLPDLPIVEQPCLTHDPSNPTCATVCAQGAPADHPPCAGKCPTPPTVDVPSCLATMPCPAPPDRRVAKCKPITKFWPPCPDPRKPDPDNPRCDGIKIPPVMGRIVGTKIQGSQTIVTVGVGSAQGIDDTWSGAVLQGNAGKDSDPELSGGKVQIIRVDKTTTTCAVGLTPDQIASNKRVRFTAP